MRKQVRVKKLSTTARSAAKPQAKRRKLTTEKQSKRFATGKLPQRTQGAQRNREGFS
jgi:hypothetical protein